eukprot:COSAG01_NODE_3197_length_6430_cov_36.427263_7_plen_194_part_00
MLLQAFPVSMSTYPPVPMTSLKAPVTPSRFISGSSEGRQTERPCKPPPCNPLKCSLIMQQLGQQKQGLHWPVGMGARPLLSYLDKHFVEYHREISGQTTPVVQVRVVKARSSHSDVVAELLGNFTRLLAGGRSEHSRRRKFTYASHTWHVSFRIGDQVVPATQSLRVNCTVSPGMHAWGDAHRSGPGSLDGDS